MLTESWRNLMRDIGIVCARNLHCLIFPLTNIMRKVVRVITQQNSIFLPLSITHLTFVIQRLQFAWVPSSCFSPPTTKSGIARCKPSIFMELVASLKPLSQGSVRRHHGASSVFLPYFQQGKTWLLTHHYLLCPSEKDQKHLKYNHQY